MNWTKIANKDRRFGSAPHYWRVRGPRHQWLLLTDLEVNRAEVRAGGNPEDLPKPKPKRPWWQWWR